MTPQSSPPSSQGFLQRSIRSLQSFSHGMTGAIIDGGKVKALPIVVIQGIVTIVAVVALIVSLTSIQSSRERAAYDSCRLITGLVFRATPRDKLASAVTFLHESGLSNCHTYSKRVTR